MWKTPTPLGSLDDYFQCSAMVVKHGGTISSTRSFFCALFADSFGSLTPIHDSPLSNRLMMYNVWAHVQLALSCWTSLTTAHPPQHVGVTDK